MKNPFLHIATLILIPLGLYGLFLNAPGYFDDLIIFQGNAWLRSGPKPSWFHVLFFDSQQTFAGYRPILMQISQWSSQLFGHHFFSWRLFNLCVHIGNGILMYALLRRLKVRHVLAWLISLIFLLHPIQTLSIQMVWKRSTLLAVFFMLVGLCVYAYQHRLFRLNKWGLLLQIIFLTLAFGCKEIAMIYPLILLAYHLLEKQNNAAMQKQEVIGFLGLFLFTAVLCWFRLDYIQGLSVPNLKAMPFHRSIEPVHYFYGSMRSVIHYIGWFFAPEPLLLNDPLPVKQVFNLFSVSYAVLLVFSCWSVVARKFKPATAFFICLFWLSFIPHTTFYPTFTFEDQIRCYLAYACLAYFLIVGLDTLLVRLTRFKTQTIALIFIAGFSCMTVLQNIKYYDPLIIWSDVVDAYPHSDYAQSSLGDVLFANHKYTESVQHYRQAYAHSNIDYYKVKIARSLWKTHSDQARVYAEIKGIDFNQFNIEEFSDYLMLFIMMENYPQAEKLLGHVIGRFHHNEKIIFTAGMLYFKQADYTKSVIFFKQVLKLNPYHSRASDYLLQSKQALDQEKQNKNHNENR